MSLGQTLFIMLFCVLWGFFLGAWWAQYRIAKYFKDKADLLRRLLESGGDDV